MNTIRCKFLIVVFAVLMANLAFQEKIAEGIFPDWDATCCEIRSVVDVPSVLMPERDGDAFESHVAIPQVAVMEHGNRGPTEDLSRLLEISEQKLDVLFVGDSTISWGFDFEQFAQQSGLHAASLSFGLNVPDQSLAQLVRRIAACFVDHGGIVILSYSWNLPSRSTRGARVQDRFVMSAASVVGCDRLAQVFDPSGRTSTANWSWRLLLDRELYNTAILDPLQETVGRWLPLWSAQIGFKDLIGHIVRPARAEVSTKGRAVAKFLRWHPSFRVPVNDSPMQWRYRPLHVETAIRSWKRFKDSTATETLVRRRRRLSRWSQAFIGRPVCIALPITVEDESRRYAEWLEYDRNECLLNYSEILKTTLAKSELDMDGNHHFANLGGLIMAYGLGKYFKDNNILKHLNGNRSIGLQSDQTIYLRTPKRQR